MPSSSFETQLGLAKTKEKEIIRIIKEEDKELFCSPYRPLGLSALTPKTDTVLAREPPHQKTQTKTGSWFVSSLHLD